MNVWQCDNDCPVKKSNRDGKYISKTLAHFIELGNINRALQFLSENPESREWCIRFQELNLRHPEASLKYDGFLLSDPVSEVPDLIFDNIMKNLSKKQQYPKSSNKKKRYSRPSKYDGDDWQQILGSNTFGKHNIKLCKSLAQMTSLPHAKHLSDCKSLEDLLSFGIRPIGKREVLRQITKKDVVQAAGSLQLCTGQKAGVESVVHSTIDLFKCVEFKLIQ